MLAKIPQLQADTVCIDLEDSVAANQKTEARRNIAQTLTALHATHHLSSPSTITPPSSSSSSSSRQPAEVLVRINAVGSRHVEADLQALRDCPHLPHGLVLPKVESAAQVQHVLSQLATHPRSASLAIIALIETAAGLSSLSSILSSLLPSTRLQALVFGGDDYASSISATRSPPASTELLMARQTVVMQARAHRLQCIDIVCIDLEDEQALRQESRQGWHWGFSGKQVVHPKQVPVVEEEYVGGSERLHWCERVVKDWQQREAAGVGAWRLDGNMIDMPTVRQAMGTLRHARACGVNISVQWEDEQPQIS